VKKFRPFLRAFPLIVLSSLAVVAILNLDIAARTVRAIQAGTFNLTRLRYDIASFDFGQRAAIKPIAQKFSPIDGMSQVYVPAGSFAMGDEGEPDENSPQHIVTLKGFWVDQVEVSNALYEKCVAAGKCIEPTLRLNPFYGKWIYRNYPVTYVSWFQAADYCAWAGRRLPTEAEWEKAARGTDSRKFPWGNERPNPRLANYADSLIGEPLPVDRYPLGASPYGALNMVGNVREWIADWYDANYYMNTPLNNPSGPETGFERSLRSGAYDADANEILTTSRYKHEPQSAGLSRGFRCVERDK